MIIVAFPPVELLHRHQLEDGGHTWRLLVKMCDTPAEIDAQQISL